MKILFSLIIILTSLVFTFAQERIIDKADFDLIRNKSREVLNTKAHRITTNAETKVSGKTEDARVSKIVIEVSGDNRRYVNEQTSNKTKTKNEYVRVGSKAFQRENGGDWKETKIQQPNQSNEIRIIEEDAEYKFLGTENLNGQTANIYIKTSKSKRIDAGNNNQEITSQENVKYWVDENGVLLKREVNRENKVGEITFNFNIISVFEYDPSIQINTPNSN